MKRLLVIALAVGLLMAMMIPMAAAAPVEKVTVCHVPGGFPAIPTFNPATDLRLFYAGHLISVAPAAVPAHLAQGGSATPGNGDGEYRTDAGGLANIALSAANNGLHFYPNADCFVTVYP